MCVLEFLTPTTSIINVQISLDGKQGGVVIPVEIRNDGRSCVETILEQIRTAMTEHRHYEMNLCVRVPEGGSIKQELRNDGGICGDLPFHKMSWYNEHCDISLTKDLVDEKLYLLCNVFCM